MDDACGCKECMDRRKNRLEGISLVERKIEEKMKKNIYSLGMPKSTLKEIIESAKEEVK